MWERYKYKNGEVRLVDQRLVRFFLFDKHQHIDGIVADPVRNADIAVMKDIRFRDPVPAFSTGKSSSPCFLPLKWNDGKLSVFP